MSLTSLGLLTPFPNSPFFLTLVSTLRIGIINVYTQGILANQHQQKIAPSHFSRVAPPSGTPPFGQPVRKVYLVSKVSGVIQIDHLHAHLYNLVRFRGVLACSVVGLNKWGEMGHLIKVLSRKTGELATVRPHILYNPARGSLV